MAMSSSANALGVYFPANVVVTVFDEFLLNNQSFSVLSVALFE
jgi:hypothetical protein